MYESAHPISAFNFLLHAACRFDEFFAACKGCRFDFLATHLYSCNADALQWYLNDCKKYNLPIWLTEFACPNGAAGPVSHQEAFMSAALTVLDADEGVERYAWFAPRTSGDWLGPSASLLQPDSSRLTQLGKVYSEGHQRMSRQAEVTQSWTSMCSPCFEVLQTLSANETANQLCYDCGIAPPSRRIAFLL